MGTSLRSLVGLKVGRSEELLFDWASTTLIARTKSNNKRR
ncbi:MAG: hypothetical protein ACJAUG_001177 [Halioglobus sp.]|jgi:hypothetical protein